jgi:hypothetical protein
MGRKKRPPRPSVQWSWQQLQGKVNSRLLTAPKLDWNLVDDRSIRYLARMGAESPWINQLAFVAVVASAHAKLDASTVYHQLARLNDVWRRLFPEYKLATFDQWDPEKHLVSFMSDTSFPDSLHARYTFLTAYTAFSRHTQSYLRALPSSERAAYEPWTLPSLSPDLVKHLSQRSEIKEAQDAQRRREADAITPHYPRLRGEAHFRWNALARLKEHYQQAVAQLELGQAELPVAFSYEEPRWGQLHFLLWDRRSFVKRHHTNYSPGTVEEAEKQWEGFSPQRNHFFLEFTGAEPHADPRTSLEPTALLWFGDLLKENLLGYAPRSENPQDRKRRQEHLRSWGYKAEAGKAVAPFSGHNPGVLTWPINQSQFIREAQKRTDGILFLIAPLFTAATFGLVALDILTTTGARMNELLQISLSPECLHTMIVSGKERLMLKMLPKMKDETGEYWVGEETKRNFKKITDLLQEHYHLPRGEPIPWVPFSQLNGRAHLFTSRPYLFQFDRDHLSEQTITACIRFLCHGMVFQASDGQIVVLGAHLLRHVFATHIHQVKKVPLDIVAVILHHRNITVTAKYAAPMEQDIDRERETILEEMATHLGDFDELVTRAPEALRQQLEEAREGVGALNRVVGGDCTCGDLCPWGFSCAGCIYKVPDPARREEMVHQRAWAAEQLAYAQAHRLGAESRKLQILLQRIDLELEEMRLIEEYRKDEQYKPLIQIQRAKQSAPLAASVLRSQASKDGATGPVYRRSTGGTG